MKKSDLVVILSVSALFIITFSIYPYLTLKEYEVIKFVQKLMFHFPNSIPIFLGNLGYYICTITASVLTSLFLLFKKKFKAFFIFLIPFTTILSLSHHIKKIFLRPRPPVELQIVPRGGTSFPSGHSVTTACIFSIVIYIILKYTENKSLKITLITLCTIWVLLVGFSRVWLGVHHPTDIMAGYIFGFLYAYIFILIDKKL